MEIWKPITNYVGIYEVSNKGNIKSLERKVPMLRNGKDVLVTIKQKLLKAKQNPEGYLFVKLYKHGKSQMCSVHRLVATEFIANPTNYECINHKDENKSNNKAENLEWCSRSYNRTYGTCEMRRFEKLKNNKKLSKPIQQLDLDGNTIKVFPSIQEAVRSIGAKRASGISGCANGRYSTSNGYKWRFNSIENKNS